MSMAAFLGAVHPPVVGSSTARRAASRNARDGSLTAGVSGRSLLTSPLPSIRAPEPDIRGTTGAYNSRGGGRGRGQYGRRGQRESLEAAEKQEFFAPQSWKQVGATAEVIEALKALGIARPSHVQAESYRALLSGAKYVAIADHAGSGKTLAYLLPFIQGMRQEEELLGPGNATVPSCPRLVVICPTEELCTQVTLVCRALAKVAKFKSSAFTGGHKLVTQKKTLKDGVDVAVCTPGRLTVLMESGAMDLTYCKAVVMDEVDVLLGDNGAFQDQVLPLAKAVGPDTRLVLVTATLPEAIFLKLQDTFPGIAAAVGPNLHRTALGITEQLVDCSGGSDLSFEGGTKRKLAALWAVMQQQPAARTIVFCNKIETCRTVENFISRQDRQEAAFVPLAYHGAVTPENRQAHLRAFLRPPQAGEPGRVLVCTDRASRGIDSVYVEHVVLFDFPRDPSEYVRRVGRTARGAAGRGTVSVLVMGRQVKLAKEIIDRNQKGLPVHTVPFTADDGFAKTNFVRQRS